MNNPVSFQTIKIVFTFLFVIFSLLVFGQKKQILNTADFIPKGYVAFDTLYGDLNKDGAEDCILIIKGTDKKLVIVDEYRGEIDRNRRGIIILFNKYMHYELALKNYTCFSSENEDGGVYFPPDLLFDIVKGNLYFHFAHGRYGYWRYTFRYQNSNFELIGYDESENHGPVIISERSINFLTKKKIVKVNTNENAESGEEIFKTITQKIDINNLLKLSDIKDIDELDMSKY